MCPLTPLLRIASSDPSRASERLPSPSAEAMSTARVRIRARVRCPAPGDRPEYRSDQLLARRQGCHSFCAGHHRRQQPRDNRSSCSPGLPISTTAPALAATTTHAPFESSPARGSTSSGTAGNRRHPGPRPTPRPPTLLDPDDTGGLKQGFSLVVHSVCPAGILTRPFRVCAAPVRRL